MSEHHSSGKNYAAGNRYSYRIGDWTQMDRIKFTINLTKAMTYRLYQKSVANPCIWRSIDGTAITDINKGATPGVNFASHYYNSVALVPSPSTDQADPSVNRCRKYLAPLTVEI